MSAPCSIDIRCRRPLPGTFAGVGFHLWHHLHNASKDLFERVIAKRWRELNPSFARVTHMQGAGQQSLDALAEHLLRLKSTGTEVYLTTWDPEDVRGDEALAAYARKVVDQLEFLVRERGATNLRQYCMTNELSLGGWASLVGDLPRFRDYHRALHRELAARGLKIKLLATDASPFENWDTIEWAARHMDEITGIYGGHHYINGHALDDPAFYPWFLSKLRWGAQLARSKGKDFILGEFGCKQDGSIRDGRKMDVCVYFGTSAEPMVGIQLAEAVIAALNAGIYAVANWTFADFPDEWRADYINKWGTFRWTGRDHGTRPHYYAYGLLTRFLRGPATAFALNCSDPAVRAAAVRHSDGGTWTVAAVNRSERDLPVTLTMDGQALNASFRRYLYDPRHVPQNPFGDMQPPDGNVDMKGGRLTDTLKAGALTVYTTAYADAVPGPVRGLTVEPLPGGARRLSWRPGNQPDLGYYRVYMRQGTGAPVQIASTVGTQIVAPPAASYEVVAVNQSGNASKPAAAP